MRGDPSLQKYNYSTETCKVNKRIFFALPVNKQRESVIFCLRNCDNGV